MHSDAERDALEDNIYRHAYENVQERRVWATIHDALPALLAVAEAELGG